MVGADYPKWRHPALPISLFGQRKFAGMGVSEVRRLKQLEDENRKLKQLVADLSLDKAMLQEVVRKKL